MTHADGEDPEPELLPGSDFYLAAFWELNSDRPVGTAAAPIPFTSIDRYASRHDIEGDDFAYFSRMIREMDTASLAHWRKQEGEQSTPAKAAKGPLMTAEMFDAIWG